MKIYNHMWCTYKENDKKDFQHQDNVKHVAIEIKNNLDSDIHCNS